MRIAATALVWMAVLAGQARGDELPPWKRLLEGKDAARAEAIENAMIRSWAEGDFNAALEDAQDLLALRESKQGKSHWEAVDTRWLVEAFRRALTLDAAGRRACAESMRLAQQAARLEAEGMIDELTIVRERIVALDVKTIGEDHLLTAVGYSDLATALRSSGRFAEAERSQRKALTRFIQLLGDGHPLTAAGHNDLALVLYEQGRYDEGEYHSRASLTLAIRLLGEHHPDTAMNYNNLGVAHEMRGEYVEAEKNYRAALERLDASLGETDPRVGACYNNLAIVLRSQDRFREAEKYYRKGLDFTVRRVGQEHSDAATAYNNLALIQRLQGQFDDAETNSRLSLGILVRLFGEAHPSTATAYHNLADVQSSRGQYADAATSYRKALIGYDTTRTRVGGSGLDRAAFTSKNSSAEPLAAVLARLDQPAPAFAAWERGLARGTWDDASTRIRWPQSARDRLQSLNEQLLRQEKLLADHLAKRSWFESGVPRRQELATELQRLQGELNALRDATEKQFGPVAGAVFNLATIQKTIPTDTALVGWLDLEGSKFAKDPEGDHLAVVLRSTGDPIWIRLVGTGPDRHWIDADDERPDQFRDALLNRDPKWKPLADALRAQRIEPMLPHLKGVKHLVVLSSPAVRGVPVEVVADGFSVSYAPSGTIFAHLRTLPKSDASGLLALGDPIFAEPKRHEPPKAGILITAVVPGGNADTASPRLLVGDVIVGYAGTAVRSLDALTPLVATQLADKPVFAKIWRDGKDYDVALKAGKLGVAFDQRPAAEAIAARRAANELLVRRGGEWKELPGTRVETDRIAELFAAPTVFTDADASETKLDALARSGDLGKFRYIHLATHGESREHAPLSSAVILSRPKPGVESDDDGELTAEEVLKRWNLKADLVTVSACQTALGKYERSEGYMGFAQAFLLAGSRSVCLSLWKVDDGATALLMRRFYQNLTGKRDGLKQPMTKSAALAEAKTWLSGLTRAEAEEMTAVVVKGVSRGKGQPALPLLPEVPKATADGDKPYAHPYYWAAFVIIGEAD